MNPRRPRRLGQPAPPKPGRWPRRHPRFSLTGTRSRPKIAIAPAEVYADLLPGLADGKNGFAWCCCPFHDDHSPSFCVNVVSGWYRCYSTSCGVTGSNIVSFVGHLLGLEPADARRELEARYG